MNKKGLNSNKSFGDQEGFRPRRLQPAENEKYNKYMLNDDDDDEQQLTKRLLLLL